jgi:hypothetical protein
MWIELSDGQWENMEDAVDEVVNHRSLPGEGEFPIREYVKVCQEIGYDRPWGVEVLSSALRELPIEEEFKRSFETTAAQFDAAVVREETVWQRPTTTGSSGCTPRWSASESSRTA